MIIEDAAFKLYDDPRRVTAVDIATEISSHARPIVARYGKWFDTTHCTVSGSTSRDTHLPEESDFDIGLLPLRVEPLSKYEKPFRKLVNDLRKALTSDSRLTQCLSEHSRIKSSDMCNYLKRVREYDRHINPKTGKPQELLTAKFKAQPDQSILEITAGSTFWHRAGLAFYNCYWRRQREFLREQERRTVLSQICLLKLFARKYKPKLGPKEKFPSSRTFEQLLMQQALRGSQKPLEDAMRIVKFQGHKKIIEEYLTLPVPDEMLKVHNHPATTGDDPKTWANVCKLASAILEGNTFGMTC